ncbi:MAG: hypothetical protein QMC67_10455 [Candidatus Wallbacteria bacterium]
MKIKMSVNFAVYLFMAVSVFLLSGGSAFAAGSDSCEISKIVGFDIKSSSEDGIKINLNAESKKLDFFPQSFDIVNDSIYMLNRYEPNLAIYNLKNKKVDFIKLNHPADKKFDARFFIDMEMNENSIFLLEQSTASIRKSDMSGKISQAFFLSGSSDVQILKFFMITPSVFAAFDTNSKSGFSFNTASYDEKNPARSVFDKFACDSENVAVSKDKLLMLKQNLKGGIEAMITPCCETEEISVPKSWSNYGIVSVLGGGRNDDFYIYSEKDEKGYIESIIKEGTGYKNKVYELKEKLCLTEYSTRHCRVKGLNNLIILNVSEKTVEFVEVVLK